MSREEAETQLTNQSKLLGLYYFLDKYGDYLNSKDPTGKPFYGITPELAQQSIETLASLIVVRHGAHPRFARRFPQTITKLLQAGYDSMKNDGKLSLCYTFKFSEDVGEFVNRNNKRTSPRGLLKAAKALINFEETEKRFNGLCQELNATEKLPIQIEIAQAGRKFAKKAQYLKCRVQTAGDFLGEEASNCSFLIKESAGRYIGYNATECSFYFNKPTNKNMPKQLGNARNLSFIVNEEAEFEKLLKTLPKADHKVVLAAKTTGESLLEHTIS